MHKFLIKWFYFSTMCLISVSFFNESLSSENIVSNLTVRHDLKTDDLKVKDTIHAEDVTVAEKLKTEDLHVKHKSKTHKLSVYNDAFIHGDLKVYGSINGSSVVGTPGPTGPAGATGAAGTFSTPLVVEDNAFTIVDATDQTKQLKFNVEGKPSAITTIITNPSANRSFIIPDINGAALVAQTGTNQVFIGGPTTALHGSGAGIQYSTSVQDSAKILLNQYGANAGIPGITTFKSRGGSIGDLAPVIPGDIIYQETASGVAGDSSTVYDSAYDSIIIPPNGVPAGQGWIAADYELKLTPLAGPAPKQMFRITSEGIFHIREVANSMAGVASLDSKGKATVSNNTITTTSRITLAIQDGGSVPNGFVYVESKNSGINFTIASSAGGLDSGVSVYYQIWEPTS